MNKLLISIFGSSPRTTILGILGAVAAIVPAYMENGKINWQNLLVAAISIVFGRLVKDSDGVNRKKSNKVAKRVLPGDVAKPE